MARRRRLMFVLIATAALLPLSCFLFIVAICSRPGTPAPAPIYDRLITKSSDVAFSPDSRLLTFTDEDNVFVVTVANEPMARRVCGTPDGIIWSITFTKDSDRLLISASEKIHIVGISDGKNQQPIPMKDLEAASASPTNDQVAGAIHFYELVGENHSLGMTAVDVFTLTNYSKPTRLVANPVVWQHPCKWSVVGRRLLTAGVTQGVLKVWNTADWTVLSEFSTPRVHSFCFGSDSNTVIWCGYDLCTVWSLTENRSISQWKSGSGSVTDVVSRPSGDVLIAKRYGTLMCWSQSGKQKWEKRLCDGRLLSFALSPNGQNVAIMHQEKAGSGFIKIWRWSDLEAKK